MRKYIIEEHDEAPTECALVVILVGTVAAIGWWFLWA